MDGKVRVGNVTAGFMLATAVLLDCFQFFLNLLPIPVIGWLLSTLIGIFALCLFSIWFVLLGVGILGGRKAGMKMTSAMLAPVIEILPLVGALPGTTLGVLGLIIASRLEDTTKKPSGTAKVILRGGPRRLPPRPANDNARGAPYAANDNEESEYRQAA